MLEMSMLKKLFKVENNLFYKTYRIFGIKFSKRKGKEPLTVEDLRCYTMASQVNSKLEKYRGCFTDKNVIIIGGGPSLKYLDTLPKNAIKIGINRAYQMKDIKFDYLFAQDKFKKQEDIDGFVDYNPNSCIKFIGLHTKQNLIRIRPAAISKIKMKEMYVLNNRRPQETLTPIDISLEPFAWYSGTVFAALQFCLFANAKKIYLAGFDCSNDGHAFSDNKVEYKQAHQYEYWEYFKNFKDTYFEETEFVSINPINLKNLFRNVYTRQYLENNPNIKNEDVEILEGDNI